MPERRYANGGTWLGTIHGRQLELATSLSSGVVRITGMAFGWIGATTAFGSRSRQQ
jgi:hypothetical protein